VHCNLSNNTKCHTWRALPGKLPSVDITDWNVVLQKLQFMPQQLKKKCPLEWRQDNHLPPCRILLILPWNYSRRGCVPPCPGDACLAQESHLSLVSFNKHWLSSCCSHQRWWVVCEYSQAGWYQMWVESKSFSLLSLFVLFLLPQCVESLTCFLNNFLPLNSGSSAASVVFTSGQLVRQGKFSMSPSTWTHFSLEEYVNRSLLLT
jgi:hypothetical protein